MAHSYDSRFPSSSFSSSSYPSSHASALRASRGPDVHVHAHAHANANANAGTPRTMRASYGYRYRSRRPPSPSVEDETASLARELPSAGGSESRDDEAQSRGTVDQYPLIEQVEQVEQVKQAKQPANYERRFVLLSDPEDHDAARPPRDTFAERPDLPDLPHLHTDVHDPSLFAKRTPTPYAYTSKQKESLAPDPDSDTQHGDKYDLIEGSDDDDEDADPRTSHLHTARPPARYSFVKSDLHKERLRESIYHDHIQPERRKPDPRSQHDPQREAYAVPTDSPKSSSSSLGSERTRPSYRATETPSYPQPEHSPRVSIAESDWHATYPPRSKPTTRPERYDTIPVPVPHINVKSPSPARQPKSEAPLPYPVDDRLVDAFMPPEEEYQHDHSYDTYTPITTSPRLDRLDSPVPGTPRERQPRFRPQMASRQNTTDEMPRSPRVRSDSVRSHFSDDGSCRDPTVNVPLSSDRPLPPCPRIEPSSKHNDWYTMEGTSTFDICPSCYQGVFADTPFARYFSQTRLYERPVERFCDFGSSPWMRLAWLLTIKRRRQSLELLRSLAKITERERDCPGDRELGTDHITWYGISDSRDGIHVANFAICICDLRMVEELFPTIKGYFTRIPATTSPYAPPSTYTCSLRVKSGRFPKYLGLLVELDAEAQTLNQRPNMPRFVQLARENAFKSECQREKSLFHKTWHFIPALPELTVCQECFEELIWPHLAHSSSIPSTIPRLFNRTIQPVPGEDPELGSSCGLYSARMRQVWDRAVKDQDFGFLEKKVLERKRAEARIGRERRDILGWMDGLPRGTWEWEKAKVELKENEEEWKIWE